MWWASGTQLNRTRNTNSNKRIETRQRTHSNGRVRWTNIFSSFSHSRRQLNQNCVEMWMAAIHKVSNWQWKRTLNWIQLKLWRIVEKVSLNRPICLRSNFDILFISNYCAWAWVFKCYKPNWLILSVYVTIGNLSLATLNATDIPYAGRTYQK